MKKRGIAYTILALTLVFGTLFGSWRSLTAERRDATEAFYVGTDQSGYGIATNLDLRVEYARNLCKIAARYDASAETTAVEDACSALESAESRPCFLCYGRNRPSTSLTVSRAPRSRC